MIMFAQADKIEAVAKFVITLRETAGCSTEEIKRLFHPKIIDAIISLRAKQERTRNGAKVMERALEAAKVEITQLRQALKDRQTVAIMRGDQYLADCIDNTGQRYQSAHLAALLEKK